MRSYPPQYPRSSNPLNPSSSLFPFPFFFAPPPTSRFCSFLFSSFLFGPFPFVFFHSSLTPPLLFFSFPLFLNSFWFLCVCVRVVCACVFANSMCVGLAHTHKNKISEKTRYSQILKKRIRAHTASSKATRLFLTK